MAKYTATLATKRPPAEVFDYLSDFSTTAEWDPGVREAKRMDDAPVAVGSEFLVVAEFLGRRNSLIYRVLEFDPPNSVTFRGASATVVSLDRITFEAFGAGTKVTYDADLTLKGPFKLADPLLALAFRRVGDRALAGMRATLDAPQTNGHR
jgi:carbon monoxide dehydrogenase subunit G